MLDYSYNNPIPYTNNETIDKLNTSKNLRIIIFTDFFTFRFKCALNFTFNFLCNNISTYFLLFLLHFQFNMAEIRSGTCSNEDPMKIPTNPPTPDQKLSTSNSLTLTIS